MILSIASRFLTIFYTVTAVNWGPFRVVHAETDDREVMVMTKVFGNDKAHCLDGSEPVYYIRKGYKDGLDKFVLYIEGGGWCFWPDGAVTNQHCEYRAKTRLGTSKLDSRNMQTTIKGILSSDSTENPQFHNWNLVYVRYCDGGSFSGTNEKPLTLPTGEKLYFQGWYIYQAIIDHLKTFHNLNSASRVVLAGTSAGGLATILRCDDTAEMLPNTFVQCISDAGFFPEMESISRSNIIRHEYEALAKLHIPKPNRFCEDNGIPLNCWLPEYASRYVESPILLVQSGYDSWQTKNMWFNNAVDEGPDLSWMSCANDLRKCSKEQMDVANVYHWIVRHSLLGYLSAKKPNHSIFFHACQNHGQFLWSPWSSLKIDGVSIKDAVSLFYEGELVKIFDKRFGENPSCMFKV